MTHEQQHGLSISQGLSQQTYAQIEALAAICNQHDKLDLKLNWNILRSRPTDATNDFLYYEDDQLVGYLALFSFNSQEAELSGMVHPNYRRRGIFTQLMAAATAECQRRNIPNILLIVEQESTSGQALAKALNPQLDHTEYKMILQTPKLPTTYTPGLEFRKIKVQDLADLAHITALAFGMDEKEVTGYTENVLNDPARQYFVGVLDGKTIGKIDVSYGPEVFIFGFAVLPEYRGRGYGRQILARTIQEILATGAQRIALEVMVENKNALSLYQSCGFETTSSYDYYRLQH